MGSYDNAKKTKREKLAAKRQKSIAKYSDNTLKQAEAYDTKSAKNIESWNESNTSNIASKNADRTSEIAEYNAGATSKQLQNQLDNYDFANTQNANLRDTELKQASRKSEAERFEAQRNLRNAALGLFGSMNQAMNGSTVGNTMSMLADRNDAENSTYWQNLQDNRNTIQNSYDDSVNSNNVAKRDAAINAIKALQDIQGDLSSNLNNIQTDLWSNIGNLRGDLFSNLANIASDTATSRRNLYADTAANLNNINPNLYVSPDKLGSGGKLSSSGYVVNGTNTGYLNNIFNTGDLYKAPGSNSTISEYEKQAQKSLDSVKQNNSTLLDYIMPANAEQNVRGKRNTLLGNDYFSQLVNGFNK